MIRLRNKPRSECKPGECIAEGCSSPRSKMAWCDTHYRLMVRDLDKNTFFIDRTPAGGISIKAGKRPVRKQPS